MIDIGLTLAATVVLSTGIVMAGFIVATYLVRKP